MPEAKTDPAPAAPAPAKSGNKLILMVGLGLLLAAGGAGGAWFALGGKNKSHDPEAKVEEKKPAKKPLFTTLEPFTVNLQDPRGERFAQIGVTLQFEDPEIEMTLKDRLPAVRNAILLLISSKQIEELLSTQGKQQLAQQIRFQAARAMGVAVAEPVAAAPAAAASAPAAAPLPSDPSVAPAIAAAAPVVVAAAPAAKVATVENPIRDVLFSQFIVQ